MGFDIARILAKKLHNTGGGRIGGKAHNLRIKSQLTKVVSVLDEFLCDSNDINILELGYGREATLLRNLAKRDRVVRCIGYEPQGKCSTNGKVELVNNLFKTDEVDLVISFDVFEHVKEPSGLIKEARGMCKKNSFIYAKIDLASHYHKRDSIESFDHYMYSTETWNKMTWNRSSYTNRLKAYEWKKIFEEHVDIISLKEEKHKMMGEIIKQKHLKEEDCISELYILGKFKQKKVE